MILSSLAGKFWLNYSEVSLKKSKDIVTVNLVFITERDSESCSIEKLFCTSCHV